jgi:ATP-dependent DNA helicase RecQ
MKRIAFIDTEIDPNTGKVLDIGCINYNGEIFHGASMSAFVSFLTGSQFLCGHNVLRHDMRFIGKALEHARFSSDCIIDTLFLSPLLFPAKPYHALLKDDKLQSEARNNPLNDAMKARDLFMDEWAAFGHLDESLKQIFGALLHKTPYFEAFFQLVGFSANKIQLEELIQQRFHNEICERANLRKIALEHPLELAYCLSLIDVFIRNGQLHSITPPWVLKNFPDVERIMLLLRNKPCVPGCGHCNRALDIHKGLKRHFGFDNYRTYAGEPLQEMAVQAAIDNKSLLAVFPTGGGKSITFQVPALMSGDNVMGLTVVISPLQSLMKDQVDNLEKSGITKAVTINGLLDPIERAKSFERVEDGAAAMLYISPESLRSRTIERLLLGRKIVRFVIDEAHCFSSWGQDFRVDYLYIGDFIKSLQEQKNLKEGIPVSCFTATAKQKVIEDICDYFREKLDLEFQIFASKSSRTNLHYKVVEKQDEEQKYQALRDLIERKNCPTIVYVSRTRKAYLLSERLTKDGFDAKPYHGKMDKQEKTDNQDAFINGNTQIMVATSAFGMGVDKKDVGAVIHYEISDSLENYVQEAGRAGRDEAIEADCFVLFNEEDLSKHFILLNQTKLSIKEIQQVWKAIKDITRFRASVSNSALEIARKAGWDDSVVEIETRVTTAISALETAGYLKRGQNMPRIFANSIRSKTAQEAIDKIMASERFVGQQKAQGVRIIKKLFSSKSRKQSNEDQPESRVDYISDHLGIVKEEVINIINLLREENILADAKDLTAFVKKADQRNRSLLIVNAYAKIEHFLLSVLEMEAQTLHIKALNEQAEQEGCEEVNISMLKTAINFWTIKNWIKSQNLPQTKNHIAMVCLQPKEVLTEKLQKRHELAAFIVGLLYDRSQTLTDSVAEREELLVAFSVLELKAAYEQSLTLFKFEVTLEDIEDALFYLSRIEAIKIEGGFLVVYNRLHIERLEQDNKKRYTKEDYQQLNQFYDNKVQQIHIVGEYAKKMLEDYKSALQFVEDYFQLNYESFLRKYFPGSKAKDLKLRMTRSKFNQLFGDLSPTQLKIINDNETQYMVVAAGPGSGKTKVLVHKLASLLLMEDVKHEQLLMITFSRAAATEFKKRLLKLIGNAANFVEIKTFHSYCFDLLGKVGTLEQSDDILKRTVDRIQSRQVEPNRITKTVLVIDEAQDMSEDEFSLIQALMDENQDMRVIAVGDDDQNIYEFRGSNAKYLERFIRDFGAYKHELVENYRSKQNLVDFSNQFVAGIRHRLKQTPIIAKQTDNGKIKVVRHQNNHLIGPLVADLKNSDLQGTVCILTKTNEEALQINGLLLKEKVSSRLIQSNEGFSLFNLVEVRHLLKLLRFEDADFIIQDADWKLAGKQLTERFARSKHSGLCMQMLSDFAASHPERKYKTDFEVFIRESKLEDFINGGSEVVMVSTIHKAKGKEFDHVFLMLKDFNASTDAAKRLVYVALTRARRQLTIHLNGDFLDSISANKLTRDVNTELPFPPNELAVQLGHKDVNLNWFRSVQQEISQLESGDSLILKTDGCYNSMGVPVVKFSRKFLESPSKKEADGYKPIDATVNFVLYWKNPDTEEEQLIILPELTYEK